MSFLVSDSFNRANSTTTLGTTDSYNGGTATTWQVLAGTWGIINNQAYNADGTANGMAVVDAGQSDVIITTTISKASTTSKIAFRVIDTGNHWIFNNGLLFKQPFSIAASGLGSWADGDIIKIELSGDTIKLYQNGALLATVTDSTYQTATKHGLSSNTGFDGSTGALFDNFQIEGVATGGTDATITAIAAAATSSAIAPTVTAQKNASITSVIASSVASGVAPTVSAQKQVTIASVAANSNATALAPTVGSTALVSVIVANAAAAGIVPAVNAIRNIEIIGSIASALSSAGVPRIRNAGWSPIGAASTTWSPIADTSTTWRESTVAPTIWR